MVSDLILDHSFWQTLPLHFKQIVIFSLADRDDGLFSRFLSTESLVSTDRLGSSDSDAASARAERFAADQTASVETTRLTRCRWTQMHTGQACGETLRQTLTGRVSFEGAGSGRDQGSQMLRGEMCVLDLETILDGDVGGRDGLVGAIPMQRRWSGGRVQVAPADR